MFRGFKILSALCFVLASVPAMAQTASSSGSAGAGLGGTVELTVSGNVLSAVSLNISGVGATVLTGTTATTGGVTAVGTLDFGSFSSQTPASATNTTFAARTTAGPAGAVIAASLSATLTYSGASSGTITLERKFPGSGLLPDIAPGNLRVASPALATWWTSTDGVSLPDPGTPYNVCTGVAGACDSGYGYVHQIAVFVPDTQVAGAFTTVVTYVGTAL